MAIPALSVLLKECWTVRRTAQQPGPTAANKVIAGIQCAVSRCLNYSVLQVFQDSTVSLQKLSFLSLSKTSPTARGDEPVQPVHRSRREQRPDRYSKPVSPSQQETATDALAPAAHRTVRQRIHRCRRDRSPSTTFRGLTVWKPKASVSRWSLA